MSGSRVRRLLDHDEVTPVRIQDETAIRDVLEAWARATRENRRSDILSNHEQSARFFDVLGPLAYDGVDAYQRSWDDWQPETEGAVRFDLDELAITADQEVAFAHALIHCGGALVDGGSFRDVVRATFCLCKHDGRWRIVHQHVSKPFAV